MAQALIRIAAAVAGGFPVELLELRADGTTAPLAAGTIPAGAIDLQEAADILVGKTPPDGLPAAGEALYAALSGALGAPLQQLLDRPEESTLLFDLEPNELQKVPWEILVWPKTIQGGRMPSRVAAAHHLVRAYRPDWMQGGPPPEGPLRILIVVGADREDRDVQPWKEIDEIQRSIRPVQRTIDLEIVEDYGELYGAITRFRPHVLHFIGHGTAEPPELAFAANEQIPALAWRADQIATEVGRAALENWRPSLAFLNACRSGRPTGELGPVAGAFLAAGTLATIAMQGDIKGEAAGRLAGVFYQGIASGMTIDQALSKARGVVGRLIDDRQASFAALTLRCRPSCVFPCFATRIDNYEARAQTCLYLPVLRFFVNQLEPRRQLCGRLWPLKADERRRNFLLIRGESGFGKTVLSTWLLDLSAYLGHRVRYVQVGEPTGVDYVRVLQLIWEGRRPDLAAISPLLDPLLFPAETAANLRQLLATVQDPALLYGAFRKALADLAADQPVTLVLDDFDKQMDEGSFWVLWEHLFVPLRRDLTNVNLILVLSEDEYELYKIESTLRQRLELRVGSDEVQLGELTPDDFNKLLVEYLEYRSQDFSPLLSELRPVAARFNIAPPLSIAKLEETTKTLAGLFGVQLTSLT